MQVKHLALISFGVFASLSGTGSFASATLDEVTVLKLTVNTDSDEYYPGDKAIVSGFVTPDILTAGQQVVLFIHDPLGAIVRSDLVLPYSNGTFLYEMPTGGELMRYSGEYKIVATYAGQYRAETTFDFTGTHIEEGPECAMGSCFYELAFNNNTYLIEYRMYGEIQAIYVNVETKSLLIDAVVETRKTSPLLISLPLNLIKAEELEQSRIQTSDNFTVLVNYTNAKSVEEVVNGTSQDYPEGYREIVISELHQGQNRVEIIGTWVVPEFDTTTLIMGAASIAGVVVWLKLGHARPKAGS